LFCFHRWWPRHAYSISRVPHNWHGCATYLTTSAWHHLCRPLSKFLCSVWTQLWVIYIHRQA